MGAHIDVEDGEGGGGEEEDQGDEVGALAHRVLDAGAGVALVALAAGCAAAIRHGGVVSNGDGPERWPLEDMWETEKGGRLTRWRRAE